MEENKTPRYTTIIHRVRIELEMTCNEYCIADTIFALSNNPKSIVPGWCYASRKTIAEFLNIHERTVRSIIERLIKKDIIEKEPNQKYLKTTEKWYNLVVLERLKMKNMVAGETTAERVKSPPQAGEKSAGGAGEKSAYNNKSYNNSNNNPKGLVAKPQRDPLKSYGRPDINAVIEHMRKSLQGSLDGSQRQNRQYAHLLLGKVKKDYPDKDSVQIVQKIIDIGMQNSFHGKNLTNFRYLYHNMQKIIHSAKADFSNPKYIKIK